MYSTCLTKGNCKEAIELLYSTIKKAEKYGNFDWQEKLALKSAWLYKVFMQAHQSSEGIRFYTFLNNYVNANKYRLKQEAKQYFKETYIKPIEEGFCALYGTRKSGKPTVDFSLAYPHCKKACELGSNPACKAQKELRNYFFSQGQIFEPQPVTTLWLILKGGLLSYVEVKDVSFSPSSGNPMFYADKTSREILFTSKKPFSGTLIITAVKDYSKIKTFRVKVKVPSSQIGNTGYIDIDFDSGYTRVYFKKLKQEEESPLNFLQIGSVTPREREISEPPFGLKLKRFIKLTNSYHLPLQFTKKYFIVGVFKPNKDNKPKCKVIVLSRSDFSVVKRLLYGDNVFRVSPDEKLLAVAGSDYKVRIFSLDNLSSPVKELQFKASITNIKYSPDGRLMGVANEDGSVYVYKTKEYKPVKQFQVGGTLWTLDFEADLLAIGGENGKILLWNYKTDKLKKFYREYKIKGVKLSKDGKLLALGTWEPHGITEVISTETGKTIWKNSNSPGSGVGFSISPDGKILASGGYKLRLYDFATGKELFSYGKKGDFVSTGFSKDGRYFAAGGKGNLLIFRVFSLK